LFPIISSFEYNFIERHKAEFGTDVASTLLYGSFDITAFVIYYKLIQLFLFRRRFWVFICSSIVYLFVYHFYRRGLYFSISHIPVFSTTIRSEALKWYNANSRINFSVVYMCMNFLCLTALAYFIRSSKQDEQMHILKEQQLLSELKYLKGQIQPHFFFNTLNNIYSLALKQSTDTAPMVAKLGEMMRYILYEADQKVVLLDREIAFLNNYIAIEKIRHTEVVSIKFDVQGVTNITRIEPFLLLPFIENAFKHGLQNETANGFVNIVLCMTENELILDVKNSKPAQKESGKTPGTGLKNVIKRLDILFEKKYQLSTNEQANEYQLLLTLQMA
jgi:LytS/YehU family sensor histidine kinase